MDRLPPKIQRILLWVSAGLGAALFIFLIYFAMGQIGEEVSLGITSSGIGVPQWWYTIGVPVFSALIVLRVFQGAYRASRKMEKG